MNIPGCDYYLIWKLNWDVELTSVFREERLADQVEEFNLYATQILPDFCTLHFAQADSQRAKQLPLTALPQLIKSILQDAFTPDGQ